MSAQQNVCFIQTNVCSLPLSHTHILSHTLILTHSHTHTLTHSHTHTLTHSHTLTLTHSHTQTHTYTLELTPSRMHAGDYYYVGFLTRAAAVATHGQLKENVVVLVDGVSVSTKAQAPTHTHTHTHTHVHSHGTRTHTRTYYQDDRQRVIVFNSMKVLGCCRKTIGKPVRFRVSGCTHTHTHTHKHITHTHTHIHTHTHTHTAPHAQTHENTRAHTHTHAHACTHTLGVRFGGTIFFIDSGASS